MKGFTWEIRIPIQRYLGKTFGRNMSRCSFMLWTIRILLKTILNNGFFCEKCIFLKFKFVGFWTKNDTPYLLRIELGKDKVLSIPNYNADRSRLCIGWSLLVGLIFVLTFVNPKKSKIEFGKDKVLDIPNYDADKGCLCIAKKGPYQH